MANYYRHPIVGYASNFGYTYCTAHGAENPGVLGTKTSKNIPHTVEPIRDPGFGNMPCDWPGCGAVIQRVPSSQYEYVDASLQENAS
jgi:hypothetical protein